MKKEISFESQNPLAFTMSGVRAHIIKMGNIKPRAEFLADETITWGGASQSQRPDLITELDTDIQVAAVRHNDAHRQMDFAVQKLTEAQDGAEKAKTNPNLSVEIVEKKLSELDESAFEKFAHVVETSNDLEKYRFNERHILPLVIKKTALPRGLVQR